jgi:lauroyl/myristoyl acyltransferase
MPDGRMGRLLSSAEAVLYWLAVAPVLARLPAAIGYRIACWRGDVLFRCRAGKRAVMAGNLRQVLAGELAPGAEDGVIREWFRLCSCEPLDVMRLRRRAAPLRQLVEIRGREHLAAALAEGSGAILCTSHFGSYHAGLSVLHASGFPVTTIGRWQHRYSTGISGLERRFWDLVYTRRIERHQQRPNIEPWPGRVQVAALAAAALRANEVVTILIDAPPLDTDRARVLEVPFLGRRATLLPGVVTLSRLTGAPVLMGFIRRCPDYRHQILEISPPVPVSGELATAFGRCAATVSDAIADSPAHWAYWGSAPDLADLGLIRPEAGIPATPDVPVPAAHGPVPVAAQVPPQGAAHTSPPHRLPGAGSADMPAPAELSDQAGPA